MKKAVFTLVLMLMAVMSFNKAAAQIESGPKIDFTKETHDYGTIKYGADG
jgi:hypothetical protein